MWKRFAKYLGIEHIFIPATKIDSSPPARVKSNHRWSPESWIGREVEYRGPGSLSDNGDVYRGRIIRLEKDNYGYTRYALVNPTKIASVQVSSYDELNPGYRKSMTNGFQMWNGRHHRTRYQVSNRSKYWKPCTVSSPRECHVLKWSGSRWKCISEVGYSSRWVNLY